MMNILADASLPGLVQAFPKPFNLTTYQNDKELRQKLIHQDVLLCRSTLSVDKDLLAFSTLQYVATASSGVDHIDENYLQSRDIQLISAKGSNAVAVADYVLATIAWLHQNHLLKGKKAAVIGAGAVGSKTAQRLLAADYNVITYDPLKALANAAFQSCTLKELYQCDLICIHAHLHNRLPYPSKNLLDKPFLEKLKANTVIINASRGSIVNEKDLLNCKKDLIYCTDVYDNEPHINKKIIDYATLCTPHIAGHSMEAKYEAVAMISRHLCRKTGLALPEYDSPFFNPSKKPNHFATWEDMILFFYNPFLETKRLKNAIDVSEMFLTLRKNHTHRHDFNIHLMNTDCDLSSVVGITRA